MRGFGPASLKGLGPTAAKRFKALPSTAAPTPTPAEAAPTAPVTFDQPGYVSGTNPPQPGITLTAAPGWFLHGERATNAGFTNGYFTESIEITDVMLFGDETGAKFPFPNLYGTIAAPLAAGTYHWRYWLVNTFGVPGPKSNIWDDTMAVVPVYTGPVGHAVGSRNGYGGNTITFIDVPFETGLQCILVYHSDQGDRTLNLTPDTGTSIEGVTPTLLTPPAPGRYIVAVQGTAGLKDVVVKLNFGANRFYAAVVSIPGAELADFSDSATNFAGYSGQTLNSTIENLVVPSPGSGIGFGTAPGYAKFDGPGANGIPILTSTDLSFQVARFPAGFNAKPTFETDDPFGNTALHCASFAG
jgi:hypothetical protein